MVGPFLRATLLLVLLLAGSSCGDDPDSRSVPGEVLAAASQREVWFADVSAAMGIDGVGKTFGAAVGDINGDGQPDIYCGRHNEEPAVYVSQPDGTYLNEVDVWIQRWWRRGDSHGAAFADFDMDGDLDLLELMGAFRGIGESSNHLFLHIVKRYLERAEKFGLAFGEARGRTPLWLDWDGDGDLDVLVTGYPRHDGRTSNGLFLHNDDHTFTHQPQLDFGDAGQVEFPMFADLDANGRMELFLVSKVFPGVVVDVGVEPVVDVSRRLKGLRKTARVSELCLADFDEDGVVDVFVGTVDNTCGFQQPALEVLEIALKASKGSVGMEFRVNGAVQVLVEPENAIGPDLIHLGAGGWHPEGQEFSLDPARAEDQGLVSLEPGAVDGLAIGFDPDTGIGRLLLSAVKSKSGNFVLRSSASITDVRPIDFEWPVEQPRNRLFINHHDAFEDASGRSGLGEKVGVRSAVAGDFDNDMDVDLYVVRSGPVGNLPNILYENLGQARFRAVPDAGGAAGSDLGRGEAVVTVDYDLDGFLDLFLMNGHEAYPFAADGPHQLFHNSAGDNHWILIDLVGTRSNVHGVGARVRLTAGGRTQVREQSGGVHRYSQNHPRLHFGLGPNQRIDEISVDWPEGPRQVLRDIAVDQVLVIRQATD